MDTKYFQIPMVNIVRNVSLELILKNPNIIEKYGMFENNYTSEELNS